MAFSSMKKPIFMEPRMKIGQKGNFHPNIHNIHEKEFHSRLSIIKGRNEAVSMFSMASWKMDKGRKSLWTCVFFFHGLMEN